MKTSWVVKLMTKDWPGDYGQEETCFKFSQAAENVKKS